MKLARLLAFALIAGLAFSSAAHAVTVTDNLGNVVAGEGPFSTPSAAAKNYSFAATGTLAAGTEIVFTYTATGGVPAAGNLTSEGSLGAAPLVTTASNGSAMTSGALPVVVTANLGTNTGTITIENLTKTAESFTAYFLSLVTEGKAVAVTVTAAVSAVPLPPTLVLFASGLLAWIGFAAYKKRSNQI